MFFFNFSCVIFAVFVKFFEGDDAGYKNKKKAGKSVSQKGAKFGTRYEIFAPGAKFRTEQQPQFCFAHNFFIRTPFWVILVSLEILESVESKYIQKEHF